MTWVVIRESLAVWFHYGCFPFPSHMWSKDSSHTHGNLFCTQKDYWRKRTTYLRLVRFRSLEKCCLNENIPSFFLHDCALCLRCATLAKCRRLTQEILLRGLGVFSTTIKLTGRPDLQSRQRQTDTSVLSWSDAMSSLQTNSCCCRRLLFFFCYHVYAGETLIFFLYFH